MELHTFTTDPSTGYLDLPDGVGLCDGDCGVAWMENELTDWHGQMLCPECLPECAANGCTNKQHEQGEELCAKCALEVARENQKHHYANGPVTAAWYAEEANLAIQCKLWEARQ